MQDRLKLVEINLLTSVRLKNGKRRWQSRLITAAFSITPVSLSHALTNLRHQLFDVAEALVWLVLVYAQPAQEPPERL